MKHSRRQSRIKKKLYRSAKGNQEQTKALDEIFEITKDMTNERAQYLISEAIAELENQREAKEIYGLDRYPSARFLAQVKLLECPKCGHLLLTGKDEGEKKCSTCGSVMVVSDKPLSGLRISQDED